MTRLLLIHHAKNFESNDCYLTDDFFEANKKLFGAQELDTWAGYRFLQHFGPTYRLQISHNLGKFQLIKDAEILIEASLDDSKTFSALPRLDYLNAFLKYWDTSIAYNSLRLLKLLIQNIIEEHKITLIWSDTQFYDAVLPKQFPLVLRSVNFEPLHVMREDHTKLRYVRRLGKIHSEKIISNSRTIVSISPRDLDLYRELTDREIEILPLRQLPYLVENREKLDESADDTELSFPFVYFAGSNFDVKHNMDNLCDIIYKIAPSLKSLHPKLKFLVFGHRFPSDLTYPDNVIRMYFRNDFYSIIKRSIAAIVPNPGGSGMQSKVFEPLCLGIPLIAHPESLSGFPFYPGEHYLRGETMSDVIESINSVISSSVETAAISENASLLCKSIFRREFYNSTIARVMHNASLR